MVSSTRLQRRVASRRNLRILRTITCSNSVRKGSIMKDAVLYIYMLKLKLEEMKRQLSTLTAIKQQYLALVNQLHHLPNNKTKEVKVEKADGKGYVVRVVCEKKLGNSNLVQMLEVFEEMGLAVLHATVSCDLSYFSMEAFVVADHHQQQQQHTTLHITQTITQAIEGGQHHAHNQGSIE